MFLIRLLARLPSGFLYLLGDFLYFVAFYVLKYRYEVVRKNLGIAFPEKTEQERKKIAKKFYRNFADVLVETLMALHITPEKLVEQVTFSNIDQLQDCKDRGLSMVALATHQCNWEWMLLSGTLQFPYDVVGVYKPLKSKDFDALMISIRSRMGTQMVSSEHIVRNIARHRDQVRCIGLIGDQRPTIWNKKTWSTMFGYPTAFHTGVEFVPRMENAAVFMASMVRKKRGHYHLEMIKLAEPPFDPENMTQIIDAYVEALEAMIKANPSDWLWSHDRWQYTPDESRAHDEKFERSGK